MWWPSFFTEKRWCGILLLGLLIAFWRPGQLSGQSVASTIRQYEVKDGLIDREIYSILEDPDGFIWLGSVKGLQRFDGQDFTTWTNQKDHPLLQDLYLVGMDEEGWLWMFNNTERKFLFFHTRNEEFQTAPQRFGAGFPLTEREPGKGLFYPSGPSPVDKKGRMVFPMNVPRQIVYYESGKGFSTGPLSPEVPAGTTLLAMDAYENLWFIQAGKNAALYCVGTDGRLRDQFPLPDCDQFSLLHQTPQQIIVSTRGEGGHNLTQIDLRSRMASTTSAAGDSYRIYANGFVMRLLADRWEVSPEGRPGQRLLSVATDRYQNSFSKGIKWVYQDSKGRIWIGGEWGLTSWDLRPGNFKRYLWFENEQEKPFHNSVRGIYADKSRLYINFESVGVAEVPLDNPDAWRLLDPDVKGVDMRSAFLSSRPLMRLREGPLAFAQSARLARMDPESGKKKVIALDDKLLWNLWALHQDEQGNIWLGGEGVLAKVDAQDRVEVTELWPGNKIWKVIYQILPDGKGNFWLSTANGLLLFDPATQKITASYGKEQAGPHHLPATVIHHHHIDADSIHWLGTDVGLVEWNPRTHQYHTYTTLDGLSSDVVYGVFEDRTGLLWLSSGYGIMRFDKKSHAVRTYLENEGITHSEFNRISCFQAADGTIYFGGMNGVTAIHPDEFRQVDQKRPLIQITGFELFDRVQNKTLKPVGQLRRSRSITFGPEVGYARISFAIPNPVDDNLIVYAWRLKEEGENWAYQKDNSIQLATLAYGTYTLQIMGKDHTGNWSAPIEITLHVPRPFYLQVWFFILLALLMLLLTFVFFRRRTAVLRRRQQQLEAEIALATARIMEDKQTIARQVEELQLLDKTKSRFFANVAHEFRTPLTLIYGPLSSVIRSGEINPDNLRLLNTARENTDSLIKMLASLMDLTRMESGKMELREMPVQLKPWLERFAAGFESLLQQKGISFEMKFTGEADFTFNVDAEKLNTILKNLFSNAVKFTPAGRQIVLSAKADLYQVVIALRDTGRGIHPDDLPFIFDRFYQSRQPGAPVEGGTGIGLALCSEFARIMQGRIEVHSQLREGSVFTLTLPYKPPAEVAFPEETSEPSAEKLSAATEPLHDESKPTLLVVEDNDSLQAYLRQILSPTCQLLQAENGKQALELLSSQPAQALPDLVISDVMMPEMDGFQLLEVMKGDARFAHLPVIMLTARAGLEDKLKALQLGVDDYLTKPFEEEELLTRVANLLRNAAVRREARRETTPAAEVPAPMSAADREWLSRLELFVSSHLNDAALSVTQLCSEFAMSESTFRRQVKRLAGLTPQEYLNEHKLNRARQLLEGGSATSVAAVAEEVGFEDAKAFTRSFKNRFGKPPSAFLV